MVKIYVVIGQSGEYSHHRSWLVRAFTSRERAEAFEIDCTKAAALYAEEYGRRSDQMQALYESLVGHVPNPFMTPEHEEANKAFHAWCNTTQPIAVPGDPGFDPEGSKGADYCTLEVDLDAGGE